MYDPDSRALGSVIAKHIKNKGFPLKIYKLLWESCVLSIGLYGAEVWGFQPKKSSDKLFHRAIRTYLGLGLTAPLAAAKAELLWLQPTSHVHLKMVNLFNKIRQLPEERLTRKVLDWELNLTNRHPTMKTWSSEIRNILSNNYLEIYFKTLVHKRYLSQSHKHSLLNKNILCYENMCRESPMLNMYCKINNFYETKSYLSMPMSFPHKKRYVQCRMGILPIRSHLGRFDRPGNPETDRLCEYCTLRKCDDIV